jgi:hypothetical protein
MPEEPTNEDSFDMPLPPADFSFLISSLMFQAQLELGLLHLGGETDQHQPNLPRAKHSIDLLGVLEEKTRNNLTLEEQRLLENGLTELRFRFIQAVDEQKKPADETAQDDDKPRIITADGGKGTKSV